MPYFAAVCGFSSTLSLTIFTLAPSEPAISSSAGAIIRQGPHHSAQKSTTTGSVAFNTSDSNVASETLPTAMAIPRYCLRKRMPNLWTPRRSVKAASRGGDAGERSIELRRGDFHEVGYIGPDQCGANGFVRIKLSQHRAIERELSHIGIRNVLDALRRRPIGLVIRKQHRIICYDEPVHLAGDGYGALGARDASDDWNLCAASRQKQFGEPRVLEQVAHRIGHALAFGSGEIRGIAREMAVRGGCPFALGNIGKRLQQAMHEHAPRHRLRALRPARARACAYHRLLVGARRRDRHDRGRLAGRLAFQPCWKFARDQRLTNVRARNAARHRHLAIAPHLSIAVIGGFNGA